MTILSNMKKFPKHVRRNDHRLSRQEKTVAPDSPVKLTRKTLLRTARQSSRELHLRTSEAAIKVLPAI